MSKDTIYSDRGAGHQSDEPPFRFNKAVVDVFPDMLQRSVPGYAASIEAIGSLAARFVQEKSRCYDLGCSLGAATIAMRQGIRQPGCHIVAVDNSPAMVARCRETLAAEPSIAGDVASVEVLEADIRNVKISDASMVTLNYTLQFLPLGDRDGMIQSAYDGLRDGGILVLSEKVVDEDPGIEALLIDLHHEHKRRNDYSALEISRKRAALDNVLIPESVADHRQRLRAAGFGRSGVWLRYFNFVSIVAIKE